MVNRTKIEWTDATWNALRGCSRASTGCANCYAEGMAGRFSDPGQWGHGIATREPESAERYILRGRWTGKVVLDEQALLKPLRWRKPRRIFVTSVSDPGHQFVTDDMLDRLFAVMALTPQHTYQLLTKRPERMREYLGRSCGRIADTIIKLRRERGDHGSVVPLPHIRPGSAWWPLPNVWLGVSVEDQRAADERIPHLLATPAALRFLSCEPLLGPVDLTNIDPTGHQRAMKAHGWSAIWKDNGIGRAWVDWVIVGGESGPKARPMHPDWVRSLRDQCAAARVPFFFKQWGEWRWGGRTSGGWYYYPSAIVGGRQDGEGSIFTPNRPDHDWGDAHVAMRVGKKAAGRLLDGQIHDAFPEVRHG